MSLANYLQQTQLLLQRAEDLERSRPEGKPEANTQDKLLTPFLEALGYGPDERTAEAGLRSLTLAKQWVDYFLLPEKRKSPWLMMEAKSFWDKNIWEANKEQVLNYLRDYAVMVGMDAPIPWLILTNFKEWHVLRLSDREPFWSFTSDQLANAEFATEVYERLARENVARDRLLYFYTERQRDTLGEQFLRDLKLWRVILANGIHQAQPELSTEELQQASLTILLRFLFIRLLENYGREPYYVLGRLYDLWSGAYGSKPFITQLQQKFEDTWESYNTELFAKNAFVDKLMIPNEYLEMLVLLNPVPDPTLVPVTEGQILGFRSIYNYDFTTLTQDILGVAYEQFLAHELVEENGVVKILDNQATRQREGVFYTPDYIVKHIVRRVLEPQVKPHLKEALDKLEQGDHAAAHQAASRILEVRVVDPACGSGSFLLGAFEYLTDALETYNRATQNAYQKSFSANGNGDLFSTGSAAAPPKQIGYPHERVLVNCIYGVDLDPQAVGLAKLSLWSQLLRAHPGQYGKKGAPHTQLPALTLNIRSGNSLIDAVSPAPDALATHADTLEKAARLSSQAKNVDATAEARRAVLAELDALTAQVNEALLPNLLPFFADDETLRQAISETGADNDDVAVGAVRHYLIAGNKPRNLDLEDKTLAEILEHLRSQSAALDEATKKRPFNWQVEFPDVFDPVLAEDERGFTAVIGNPPYFNVDATFGRGALEFDWFRYAYTDIYTDKTDILFYFFRRGYDVLRPDGELGLIVSRSFLQGDKSKKLRQFLASRTTLLEFLDFLGHRVFKAGIATTIVQWRKTPAPEDHKLTMSYVLDFDAVRGRLEQNQHPQDGVVRLEASQADLDEDRWMLSPYGKMFKRIDSVGTQLKHLDTVAVIEQGIQTGENEIFSEDLPDSLIVDDKRIFSRVHNSDIHALGIVPSEARVLYIENETDFASLLSEIQSYLKTNEDKLKSRAAYREGSCEWYALHRSRRKGGHHHFRPKILVPYRASENRFAVDETGLLAGLTDTTVLFAKDDNLNVLYALCALLNSSVLNFRYRALGGIGKLTGKGMFEYFENQVGDLPIPDLSKQDEAHLPELGRRAHELFRQRYALVEAYQRVLYGQIQHETPFWSYHDSAGDYGHLVSYTGSDPNRVGHLLGLRVAATATGYTLWGEVTEAADWRSGEREWLELAEVTVAHEALRHLLLFRAHYQTEFDEGFRRKQKFTQGDGENVLLAAFRSLSAPLYDSDAVRNLRILDTLEKRVMESVDSGALEQVMLAFEAVEADIDAVAYRVYGVEEHRADIEAALKVVL